MWATSFAEAPEGKGETENAPWKPIASSIAVTLSARVWKPSRRTREHPESGRRLAGCGPCHWIMVGAMPCKGKLPFRGIEMVQLKSSRVMGIAYPETTGDAMSA